MVGCNSIQDADAGNWRFAVDDLADGSKTVRQVLSDCGIAHGRAGPDDIDACFPACLGYYRSPV